MSAVIKPNIKCKVELPPLVEKFKLTKTITGIKYGKKYKKGDVNNNTQGFYNSITFNIKLKNNRKVSAKLCNDLVVHIAGLRGLHEAYLVAKLLYSKIIKKDMLSEIVKVDSLRPISHEIILMNSGYNANITIDRIKLVEICMKKYKYTSFFTPGTYSGVKIYPEGNLAILVFRTGKIIVTGSRNMKKLIDGYFLIEKILQDNYLEIIENNSNLVFN
jgi:hypothetical protein